MRFIWPRRSGCTSLRPSLDPKTRQGIQAVKSDSEGRRRFLMIKDNLASGDGGPAPSMSERLDFTEGELSPIPCLGKCNGPSIERQRSEILTRTDPWRPVTSSDIRTIRSGDAGT